MLFLSFVFIFFVSLPFHYISFLSVHQFGKGGTKKYLGDRANEVVKHIINEMGFTSTTGLRVSDYAKVMAELQEFVENEEAQQEEVVEEE